MTVELGKYMVALEPSPSPTGKTQVWPIISVRGAKLGSVKFLGRWRCYVFAPDEDTVFNAACMQELVEFCEARTNEWRNK